MDRESPHSRVRIYWPIFIMIIAAISCGAPVREHIPSVAPSVQSSIPAITTPVSSTQPPGEIPLLTPTQSHSGKLYRLIDQPWNDHITGIWTTSAGNLWITSWKGIFSLQNGKWDLVNDQSAQKLLGLDKDGNPWIITNGGSNITVENSGTWFTFGENQGWNSIPASVYPGLGFGDNLITDEHGNLWIATGKNDIRRYDPQLKAWEHITASEIGFSSLEKPTIQEYYLTDIQVSVANNVWVSECTPDGDVFSGQGIRRNDGTKWLEVSYTAGKCITSMAIDRFGQIWAGTQNALLQYNPVDDSWKSYPLPPYLSQQIILKVNIDQRDLPWATVKTGGTSREPGGILVYYLAYTRWVKMYESNHWSKPSFIFQKNGTGWMCVNGSLYSFSQEKMILEGSLNSANCQIAIDQSGRLWLAALDGQDVGLWYLNP